MRDFRDVSGRRGVRHGRGRGAFIAGLALVPALLAGVPQARATELAAPAAGEFYGPQEPLSFALSAEVMASFQGRFALEIDRFDVSDLVSIEGGAVVFTPASPLAPGPHHVKLFELRGDGPPILLGEWQITVSGEGGGSSGPDINLAGEATLEARQRLASHNLANSSDPHGLSGAAQAALNVEEGPIVVDFSGNAFLETDEQYSLTGNKADIGEYLADVTYDASEETGLAAGLRIGHHDPASNSLIMSNFYRRGVSAWVSGLDGDLRASAFSVANEALLGGADPFGQYSRSGELHGVALESGRFDLGIASVKLSGIYYQGEEGTDPDASFAGEGELQSVTPRDGDGWSARVETGWLDERLSLSGEVARSKLDEDGAGALDEEDASAYALDATYDMLRNTYWGDDPVSLSLSANWYKIDTFFGSLGNPGVAADREGFGGGAYLNTGGLSLNLSGRDETNNVDDLSGLPTERLQFASLNGSYYPVIEREEPEALAWLGQPYLNFGLSLARIDRDETPQGYLGPDTGNQSWTAYGGVGSYYGDWSWGLTHTRSVYEDETDLVADTRNDLTDITASWTVSQYLSLSSGVQFGTYKDRQTGNTTHQVNWLANMDAALIPETLLAKLNYNLNLLSGSGDTPDRNVAAGELEWVFQKASETRPRLSLALRGAWETNDGYAVPTDNQSRYETFAVLRIQAPVGYR